MPGGESMLTCLTLLLMPSAQGTEAAPSNAARQQVMVTNRPGPRNHLRGATRYRIRVEMVSPWLPRTTGSR